MLLGNDGTAFNPSTREGEAGGSISEFKASLKLHLQSEFQDSQEYTEKPCLEKAKIYIKKG